MKKLIVFDLDGTQAESKSPIYSGMATLLEARTKRIPITDPTETGRLRSSFTAFRKPTESNQ